MSQRLVAQSGEVSLLDCPELTLFTGYLLYDRRQDAGLGGPLISPCTSILVYKAAKGFYSMLNQVGDTKISKERDLDTKCRKYWLVA